MPRYDMGSLEPPSDDLQDIIDQERFEESDGYEDVVRDWMVNSDDMMNEAFARFPLSGEYENLFEKWRKP